MKFKIPMVGLDKKTGLSVSAPSAPCVVSVKAKAHLMALMHGGGGAQQGNGAASSGTMNSETGVRDEGMTPDREQQDREPERQWLRTYAHRDWKEYELVIVNFPPQEPRIALSDSWWLTQRPLSGIPSQVRLGNLTVTKRNTTSHKLFLRVLVFHENIWWETPWVIITAGLSLQQQQAIPPLFMSPPKVVQQAVPQVSPFVNTGPSSQSVQEVMRLREILQRQQESMAASRPCESFRASPTDLSINPRNIKFTGIRFELYLPNAMVANWAERVWNELCVDTMLNWGTLVDKFRHDFNQDLTPLKALVCGPENTVPKKLWYGLANHLVHARDKYIFCDAAAIELWKTARWFHGVISKFQADSRLYLAHQTAKADAERSPNTFLWLMRLSEIEPSLFDLSFKAKLCIYHMSIGHCRPGDTHYWTGGTPVLEPIPPSKYGMGGQYYIVNSNKVADTLDELVKKVLDNSPSAEFHEVHRPDLPQVSPFANTGSSSQSVQEVTRLCEILQRQQESMAASQQQDSFGGNLETPLPLSFPSVNERLATLQATMQPVPKSYSSAEQRQKASLKKQLEPLFAPDMSNPLGLPRGVKVFKPIYDPQLYKLKKLQITERKPSTSLRTSVPLTDGWLTISKIEPGERSPMPVLLAQIAVTKITYTVSQYEWDESHQRYRTPNIFYKIPNFVVSESTPEVSANITWNPSLRPMTPTVYNIDQLWSQKWSCATQVSWVCFAQCCLEVLHIDVCDMKDIILCNEAEEYITHSRWERLYPYWANFNSGQIDMDAFNMWQSSSWFYGLHSRNHCESLVSGGLSQNTILIRCSDSKNAFYVATISVANIVQHIRIGHRQPGERGIWAEHMGIPYYEQNPPLAPQQSNTHIYSDSEWYLLQNTGDLYDNGPSAASTRPTLEDLLIQVLCPSFGNPTILYRQIQKNFR
ncbi:hypothetical protein Pelo_17631 [Pelomyxa schiedti]|nr:hypothetical protein Pelo_17631 [Pelomyxa schiedti]